MSEEVSENKNQIVSFVPNESSIKKRDVFVGNLSLYTTGERLKNFFSKHGEVENVRIMIHPETRRSRRFGFITFKNESSVTSVLQCQDSQRFQLDGKTLDVKHAFKRSDEEGGVQPVQKTKQPFVPKNVFEQYKSGLNQNTDHAKIFVGGLGQDLNEEAVRSYFSTFGEIKKINLVMDKVTKRSKGFCFIVFSNEISAVAACMNNTHYIKEKTSGCQKSHFKYENSCSGLSSF